MALEHDPHILITRPSGQYKQLALGCQALGFRVSHLPCLAIEGIQNESLLEEYVAKAGSILFTSKNAVEYAHVLQPFPWNQASILAIGPATAKSLTDKGQALAWEPKAPYNSDALLEQLVQVSPARLTIVKGIGGRTAINDSLSELGWHIDTIDVYKRVRPVLAPELVDDVFKSTAPDIISISSNETLSNLMTLIGKHRSTLLRCQLLVNSERCAELAETLGFALPALVAQFAGDQGQVSTLKHWLKLTFDDPV